MIRWSWKFGGPKKVEKQMFLVEREFFTDESTIGRVSLHDDFLCFSLEDTCRREKVYGKTAIPSGTYEITLDHSPKFGKVLPHILDVPGFVGIRVHGGNRPEHTLGCPIIGMRHGTNEIYDSTKAMDIFVRNLTEQLAKGKAYITFSGGVPQDQFKA